MTTRAKSRPGPVVSVVLPVLNEARDIERLLWVLLKQRPPEGGFEVVVADGGSTDGTREIVGKLKRQWPNLRLVDNPKRLSSAGRNAGARASRGRYVMFLDGHCSIPRDDYLIRLVEIFEKTGAHCLCRPQPLLPMAEGVWGRAIATARHSFLGHNVGSDIYTGEAGFTDPRSAGAAYQRMVIEELGGYDERFDACEDVEFNHRVSRAGFLSYIDPDLAVHYVPRSDLPSLFRQMGRYGRGRARLAALPSGPIPWALVGSTLAVVSVITSFVLGGSTIALSASEVVAGVWLALATCESVRLARSPGCAARLGMAMATIHAGLVLGFWRGLLEFHRFHKPISKGR